MDGIVSPGLLSKCDRCAIRDLSICGDANDTVKAALGRISHFHNYAEGETIVAEGDDVGVVGNVISGVLKLVKTLPDGRQHIVGLIHPAGMFGKVF